MQSHWDTVTSQSCANRITSARWLSAATCVCLVLAACSGTGSAGGTSTAGGHGNQSDGGATANDGTVNGGTSSSSTLVTITGSGGTLGSSTATAFAGTGGTKITSSTLVGGTSSTSSGRSRCKRGVAYGHHSDADMTALSAKVVWWYNWDYLPDRSLTADINKQLSVEFVPMVWGPGVNLSDVESRIPASATTLLGYNEAIADKKGLRLASTAVNYCGGGCHDTDPFSYLKDFFNACPACRVDVIAVHVYVGCQITSGNHAQWLIDHLKRYQAEFSQPIWLTEFACDDARNVAEQKAFLEDAVTYLEATPRIERYAWFATRADNVPYVDLLGSSGELSELGRAYLGAPVNADCQP
jgi:hypothetical protein